MSLDTNIFATKIVGPFVCQIDENNIYAEIFLTK